MSGENRLILFAKTPRLGAVKRRLAAGIGAPRATAFHRWTTCAMLRRLGRDKRWRCILAVAPARDAEDPLWDRLGARGIARMGQAEGDLGRRMAAAFAALPRGPAVLIGTDIPAIAPAHIAGAFRALGRHDAVFGPAEDGGYWLVGFRDPRRAREAFAEVRWSSPQALADTRANLPKRTRVALLETLADVDNAADYAAWREARQPFGTIQTDFAAATSVPSSE